MKIAFLNLYQNVNNRGAETFASGLAEHFAKNHDVWFFATKESETPPTYRAITIKTNVLQPTSGFSNGTINNIRKRLFLDSASLAVLFFSLKSLPILWREKFDVLRPVNGFWELLICKIVTLFRGGKVIVRGASGAGWDERWNLWLKPDIFVATTPDMAAWARKVAPWTHVEMIPMAVDVDQFENAKKVSLDLERPIILCPAAADKYKRVNLAIEAIAKLAKGSLLHLGNGEQKQQIIDLGNKVLGQKRFYSTTVPLSQMPSYYAACDLVTLPSSDQESFGIVLIEAMASGKIVVATEAPRPRWILGKLGIFVDPTNIAAYAKAIQIGLETNFDRQEAKQSLKRFSWDSISQEYENRVLTK